MAASLAIVMLTDLAGDEIWTEEGGRCGPPRKWGVFGLVDHPEFCVKTTAGNDNKHGRVFVNKARTMWLNVVISSHRELRQCKLSGK